MFVLNSSFRLGVDTFSLCPMHLRTVLHHIGFLGREADIYLTALQLGTQPASIIAEKLKINRITTYSTLKKLVERGLATISIRNNMHYFTVESPEKLLTYIARKEEEWKQLQEKLRQALLDLEVPEHPSASPIKAASYFGVEGCKTLFDEALIAEKLVLVLNPLDKHSDYRELWLDVFFVRLLQNMPSTVHIFTVRDALRPTLIEKLEDKGAEVYILESLPFTMDLILCDDSKSAFIAEKDGVFSGAMIEGSRDQASLQEFFARTLSSLAGGFNFLVTRNG